ncbi:unknown protein [Mesoplasma florum L1]|uniref:YokE-like PH domain-containing protein n=1 Tax=Mesoplasma florum (strain ATCC 33453 / NBRC 100688 / NCTC 11704 / L1) TaxID=265311 RepID=Q6F0Y0_MESFL|nr:PH domain-containing protein [Mesoplasma florum]AAT75843.1 unknown protein [Mesoplasma florum L1]ATI73451.1 hypothetical protein CQZ69_02680 [Mesoplasma florum]AVN61844.1 hypothetical protein CG004_02665 [Mesoplasma florum]
MNNKEYLSKLEIYNFDKYQLIDKKEFNEVEKYFLSDEYVIDIIVGEINAFAHMILLTNKRLFTISKFIQTASQIKQYGLEQIEDVKLGVLGDIADLTMIFKNGNIFKIDYLHTEVAQKFGYNISKMYDEFIKSL